MKTNNVLKTGFFAIAFALLSMGVKAQNYTPFTASGTTESIDTVTVGSRMPYKMAGDPIIANIVSQGKMKSEFKWAFYNTHLSTVSGSPLAWPILKGTTTSAATVGTAPNYYTDKEINVVMPGSAGKYSLVINERTIILPGNTPGCEGTDSIAFIQVVDKPTLTWPATKETTACGTIPLSADVDITVTLGGYGQWIATYDVLYTALTSGATQTTRLSGQTANLGVVGSKAGQYTLSISAATFNAAGVYQIKITNLTDRISRKSLDPIAAFAGTDIPAASDLYTVNLYPAPVTNKLQHVKNML